MKQYCFILLFLISIYGCQRNSETIHPTNPPNILMIAIDDLNDWVNLLEGYPLAKTPNLDRLMRESVYFTNAHCSAPICQASRNSLMTGLNPSTTGWYSNYPQKTYDSLNAISDALHLPEFFKSNGYYTQAAGKIYHHGVADIKKDTLWDETMPLWSLPDNLRNRTPGYDLKFEPFPADGGKILSKLGIKSGFSLCGGPLSRDSLPNGKMYDELIAEWGVDKIRQAPGDKPFFLATGFVRPHVPYTAPEEYFDLYPIDSIKIPEIPPDEMADIPLMGKAMAMGLIPGGDHAAVMKLGTQYWKELTQAYLACVSFVDDQVGKLLDALETTGKMDNTIIVLWSDHGQNFGEKHNWRKMCLWEESTRVPLVIKLPNNLPKRNTCEVPASLLDIYPTLADAAGFPVPESLEGKSLLPFVMEPDTKKDTAVLTTWLFENYAVRSSQWRYIQYRDGTEELYNHLIDPKENQNLAGQEDYTEIIDWHRQFIPKEAEPVVNSAERKSDRLDNLLMEWEKTGIPAWLQ